LITAVLTYEIEQTTEFANGLGKLHRQGDWGWPKESIGLPNISTEGYTAWATEVNRNSTRVTLKNLLDGVYIT
jgi:hypothetical protein